ncbi:MAG: branched-chain amino acid transport system II carrier protein [Intestinibacter sp.]
MASTKSDGDTGRVFGRAGKLFAIILGSAIMICLGPLLAIPRTAATTFEMGIIPLIPGCSIIFDNILCYNIGFNNKAI